MLLHRLGCRLEQTDDPEAGLTVAVRPRPPATQSTKCAASTCSASVTASFGAHMSPVR